MEKIYNKLVRDGIPEIIKSNGGQPFCHELSDREFEEALNDKLFEELKEVCEATGRERIEETIDPELTIDRALDTYQKKGYSKEWINQRLQAIQVRKEMTDEWDKRGVQKGVEYAILTDEITKAWSGMKTREYKNLKGLKKENVALTVSAEYDII